MYGAKSRPRSELSTCVCVCLEGQVRNFQIQFTNQARSRAHERVHVNHVSGRIGMYMHGRVR